TSSRWRPRRAGCRRVGSRVGKRRGRRPPSCRLRCVGIPPGRGPAPSPVVPWRRSPGQSSSYLLEAHPGPGTQEGGRVTVGVPDVEVGVSDQLPTTRRRAWVDPAVASSESDGPGGNVGTRLGAAGNGESWGSAGEVSESGGEATETHGPLRSGVFGDDLAFAQPGQVRDVGEIAAVVCHGDVQQLPGGC